MGVDTGRRPAARRAGAAEQLGDAEQGEDLDGRHAATATEAAAGHDADRVVGDDDRDGRQRIVALGPPHGGRQRVERGSAVGGHGDVDRHVVDPTDGVSSPHAGRAASARRRSSATAWPSPSGSRYSAVPATSTLAPAAAAPPTVSGAMPPSTSMSTASARPRSAEHPGDLGHLRLHRRQVRLAPEARVDGHHQHQLDQVEDVGDGRRRRGRDDGHGGGGAEVVADHPQRPVQVGGRLGVHDQAPAAGLDESSGQDLRREDHQVGLERAPTPARAPRRRRRGRTSGWGRTDRPSRPTG